MPVNLGEYSFKLISYKPLPKLKFGENFILESESIINITIHENSKIKSITLSSDSERFKKNLSRNLLKKYNYFSKEKIDEDFDLFENIEIEEIENTLKAVKINFIKNSDNWFDVIGSRYRLKAGKINETQKRILEMCYDLGFGERNTFGFGFMNLKGPSKNGRCLKTA